eukprot:TRINITY_DN437_c0_g1_i1.p2 TRINITY_DN437_c0_g1~~TRINITY_DN437_c0_g1_i1.p2  ORF type:complete len:123 (+),score=38.81 TRINITY_DN437_c0_g1_i1:33-401(+)
MAKQIADFSRLLDGIFFSIFMLFTSGFSLFLIGEGYKAVVNNEGKKMDKFAKIAVKLFPFTDRKYEFSLTHVMLMAMLICLLCLLHHPAQDVIDHRKKEQEKRAKRKQKQEAKQAKDASESK